jgi:hypothetical protein
MPSPRGGARFSCCDGETSAASTSRCRPAVVLLNSAAQEDVPDRVLGRVMGVISLVHRGAHATGLLLIAPLFAVLEPELVFVAAALTVPLAAGACASWALVSRRGVGAPAPVTARSPRS